MREIAEVTAARHGLTLADLKGSDKTRRYCAARQEAMFRMRMAKKSSPEIGKFLGGRDHTTVLLGVRRHIDRTAGGPAGGVAARIAVHMQAAMMDSPGWPELTTHRRAELVAFVEEIGRELAPPAIIARTTTTAKDAADV